MSEQKQTQTKPAAAKPASRQSMTPEQAKQLGLDPGPYGKPAKK